MAEVKIATPEQEMAEVRQAIRELYMLECRFKPASFERAREQGQPMEALEKILAEAKPE